MKISDAIALLSALKDRYGEGEVYATNDAEITRGGASEFYSVEVTTSKKGKVRFFLVSKDEYKELTKGMFRHSRPENLETIESKD